MVRLRTLLRLLLLLSPHLTARIIFNLVRFAQKKIQQLIRVIEEQEVNKQFVLQATTSTLTIMDESLSSSSSSLLHPLQCPLDQLDNELLASVATFLHGTEFVRFTGASHSLHSLTRVSWLWRELIHQEFSHFDHLRQPTSILSTSSQRSLHYPVDEIIAHNIAASERARMERSMRDDPPELENLDRDGEFGSRPEVELGSGEPFEGIRMEEEKINDEEEDAEIEIASSTKMTDDDPPASSISSNIEPESTPESIITAPSPSPSPGLNSVASPALRQAYANLYAITHPTKMRWFERSSVVSTSPTARVLRPMHASEAHSMVALSGYLISLVGFARFGPCSNIYVRNIETSSHWVQCQTSRVETTTAVAAAASASSTVIPPPPSGPRILDTANGPRRGIYGCPCIKLDERHALLLSGLSHAGYSGAQTRCYLLRLEVTESTQSNAAASSSPPAAASTSTSMSDENTPAAASSATSAAASSSPSSSVNSCSNVNLRWLPLPSCARLLPQPHCYGSVAFHAESGRVFVFGGMDEDGPTNGLSVLSLNTMQWIRTDTTGSKPPPMHSHTCSIVNNKLWVIGGATGQDPPRSGNDLQDLYTLDLSTLVWKMVTLRIRGERPTLTRRHRGHAVGEMIVFVGVDTTKQREAKLQRKKEEIQENELRQRKNSANTKAASSSDATTRDRSPSDAKSSTAAAASASSSSASSYSSTHFRAPPSPHRYHAGAVILDTRNMQWIWPDVEDYDHAPLFPRYAAASVFDGSAIHLYGGCMSGGATLGDLWSLKLNYSLSAFEEHAPLFEVERKEESDVLAQRMQRRGLSEDDSSAPSPNDESGTITEFDVRDFLDLYFRLQAPDLVGEGEIEGLRMPFVFARVAQAMARVAQQPIHHAPVHADEDGDDDDEMKAGGGSATANTNTNDEDEDETEDYGGTDDAPSWDEYIGEAGDDASEDEANDEEVGYEPQIDDDNEIGED